ncbi:MAG: DUF2853 family protein [Planctomycetes bacterium]|jgi:hypothetical protein|nr:DUF2853 family protein [Planctomycetota bacterium]
MADYVADLKKYVPAPNEKAIAGLVKHFGIALKEGSDSSFVSVTDKAEVGRVRDNFLKKKCGLTQADTELDAAIQEIGTRMKAEHRKHRVVFCYLLAEKFGKLGLFGG